jgi:hypothetical protein
VGEEQRPHWIVGQARWSQCWWQWLGERIGGRPATLRAGAHADMYGHRCTYGWHGGWGWSPGIRARGGPGHVDNPPKEGWHGRRQTGSMTGQTLRDAAWWDPAEANAHPRAGTEAIVAGTPGRRTHLLVHGKTHHAGQRWAVSGQTRVATRSLGTTVPIGWENTPHEWGSVAVGAPEI